MRLLARLLPAYDCAQGSHDGFTRARLELRPMTAFLDMIRKLFSRRPAYALVPVRANTARRAHRGCR
jgi:hypothetical protein